MNLLIPVLLRPSEQFFQTAQYSLLHLVFRLKAGGTYFQLLIVIQQHCFQMPVTGKLFTTPADSSASDRTAPVAYSATPLY
jgi:hypothetical protein